MPRGSTDPQDRPSALPKIVHCRVHRVVEDRSERITEPESNPQLKIGAASAATDQNLVLRYTFTRQENLIPDSRNAAAPIEAQTSNNPYAESDSNLNPV